MDTPGQIAGRYEIGDRIGQGGMGDVFRGRDIQTGDPVAIKFLKPDIVADDPDLVERFEREGEALRKLNHPNIVKMLAAVQEGDRHYLVMEYVGGGSLRDLLEETPQLAIQRVLEIALDLSDALTRAHRLKIIHRDIKPANVLLAEDGTPRLTDFGVAQMGDRSRVTESGSMIGTYAYMSPEGCSGDSLDARTDIWSFGVMLYEMLAGRRPFEGVMPAAVLTAILTKPVPDLLQYRPDAPAPLLGLIYSMLEKDLNKRISSVRLVGAQLEAFIKGSDTAIERMARVFGDPEHAATPTPSVVTLQPGEADTLEVTPRTPPTPRAAANRTVKEVVGAPRIFLSYRRDDSIAVTGRLYDRLAAAFGEDYVFKDVDKIPVGANFKQILEDEVASCDVLLAVIGTQWLNTPDEAGQRRLDDPNDFVRIEIAAALNRPDILLIPVLVNNAAMPGADTLPPALAELAYRNAAVVRNDPDFNRDSSRLIEQVQGSFVVVPAQEAARPPVARRRRPIWLAAALVVLAVVAAVLYLPALRGGIPAVTPAATPGTIQQGYYLALVAQIEHTGGETRDVTGNILTDLRRQLEEEVPLSQIIVREYPQPIRSPEEALRIAEEQGASLVIRGRYDERGVEIDIEAGSLAPFPYNQFDRADIENLTNIHLELTDERTESLALPVLAVMQTLYTADGDGLGVGRNTVAGNLLDISESAEITGTSPAALWSRTLIYFMGNEAQAAEAEVNHAIQRDPGNAMLYLGRALIRQKLGQLDIARDDAHTAEARGPEGWGSPLVTLGNDALMLRGQAIEALPYYDRLVRARPDDPFSYNLRGFGYYALEQYDEALFDVEEAIRLKSQFNFPHFIAIAVYLRQGRLADAQTIVAMVSERFPDPDAGELIVRAVYSESAVGFPIVPLTKAFGNLTLGQWREVITAVDSAAMRGVTRSDLYLMQGFAYCNLQDFISAEAAYTAGLALDPDMSILLALRGEARFRQNDLGGAAQDMSALQRSEIGAAFTPVIPLIQSGDLGCENIFAFDFSALATAEAGATVAPTPLPAVEAVTPEATSGAAANRYIVLVAELEALGEPREVTRFIARDLTSRLQTGIPFSQVVIQQTETVITTPEEAVQAAEEAGAAVVIWGSYTDDLIEVEVQAGSLDGFRHIAFDRDVLERIANVTVHLTDARRDSLANPALTVLAVMQLADGNAFEVLRTLAIMETIDAPLPEIEGGGVVASVHRSMELYFDDPAGAAETISEAIALDRGNPLLYATRAAMYQRAGQFEQAAQDMDSVERLAPDWDYAVSLHTTDALLHDDAPLGIDLYTQLIELRPDDWFVYNMRGWYYYLSGDFAAANTDLTRSIELGPNVNFPYVTAGLIALREGRMADARGYLETILREFPDTGFSLRLIEAYLGEQGRQSVVGPLFGAVGSFILEQHNLTLANAQAALEVNPTLSDLYAIQGFAQCNLGQYAEAEESYTQGIELAPDVALLYLLRGDVRQKQTNLLGALEDANAARSMINSSGQGEELIAYLDAGLRFEVGCQNFFEWQPPG